MLHLVSIYKLVSLIKKSMVSFNKNIQVLFAIVLIMALLILLKGFLIPFAYGLLLAMIIYPICKKMEVKKVPRPLAVFLSLLVVVLLLLIVVIIFVFQMRAIRSELPELSSKLIKFLLNTQQWISSSLGFSISEQDDIISDAIKSLLLNIGEVLSGSMNLAIDTVLFLVIIPLYTALILMYRGLLVNFLSAIIGQKYKERLPVVLSETIHVYYNYVIGILQVYIIVGILNSIGLLLLGVHYAILFGMVTAFMTIIPYIGIIMSAILPITMIWIQTNNVLYPIGVIAIFTFVQYLEANIIFPYVVGKQLGINTLASIISIFLGGVIWGVSGMVLFLPFIAMLKIISNHIDELMPLNAVLGIPKYV